MREDSWLAERLGRPCFTVEPGDQVAALPGEGFLQAKVPAGAVDRVAALEAAGFRVVDVNLRLRRAPGALAAPPGWRVRPATLADGEAVVAIAGDHLTTSRFHLDPLIGPETAARIKRDWARAALDGARGSGVLVPARDGELAGFLAIVDDGDRRVIDLIAVHADARRTGAGRALVAALAAAAPGGIDVGTQVANVGALNFYVSIGFEVVAAQYVLHCHR